MDGSKKLYPMYGQILMAAALVVAWVIQLVVFNIPLVDGAFRLLDQYSLVLGYATRTVLWLTVTSLLFFKAHRELPHMCGGVRDLVALSFTGLPMATLQLDATIAHLVPVAVTAALTFFGAERTAVRRERAAALPRLGKRVVKISPGTVVEMEREDNGDEDPIRALRRISNELGTSEGTVGLTWDISIRTSDGVRALFYGLIALIFLLVVAYKFGRAVGRPGPKGDQARELLGRCKRDQQSALPMLIEHYAFTSWWAKCLSFIVALLGLDSISSGRDVLKWIAKLGATFGIIRTLDAIFGLFFPALYAEQRKQEQENWIIKNLLGTIGVAQGTVEALRYWTPSRKATEDLGMIMASNKLIEKKFTTLQERLRAIDDSDPYDRQYKSQCIVRHALNDVELIEGLLATLGMECYEAHHKGLLTEPAVQKITKEIVHLISAVAIAKVTLVVLSEMPVQTWDQSRFVPSSGLKKFGIKPDDHHVMFREIDWTHLDAWYQTQSDRYRRSDNGKAAFIIRIKAAFADGSRVEDADHCQKLIERGWRFILEEKALSERFAGIAALPETIKNLSAQLNEVIGNTMIGDPSKMTWRERVAEKFKTAKFVVKGLRARDYASLLLLMVVGVLLLMAAVKLVNAIRKGNAFKQLKDRALLKAAEARQKIFDRDRRVIKQLDRDLSGPEGAMIEQSLKEEFDAKGRISVGSFVIDQTGIYLQSDTLTLPQCDAETPALAAAVEEQWMSGTPKAWGMPHKGGRAGGRLRGKNWEEEPAHGKNKKDRKAIDVANFGAWLDEAGIGGGASDDGPEDDEEVEKEAVNLPDSDRDALLKAEKFLAEFHNAGVEKFDRGTLKNYFVNLLGMTDKEARKDEAFDLASRAEKLFDHLEGLAYNRERSLSRAFRSEVKATAEELSSAHRGLSDYVKSQQSQAVPADPTSQTRQSDDGIPRAPVQPTAVQKPAKAVHLEEIVALKELVREQQRAAELQNQRSRKELDDFRTLVMKTLVEKAAETPGVARAAEALSKAADEDAQRRALHLKEKDEEIVALRVKLEEAKIKAAKLEGEQRASKNWKTGSGEPATPKETPVQEILVPSTKCCGRVFKSQAAREQHIQSAHSEPVKGPKGSKPGKQ